jgi:hypothetical protein
MLLARLQSEKEGSHVHTRHAWAGRSDVVLDMARLRGSRCGNLLAVAYSAEQGKEKGNGKGTCKVCKPTSATDAKEASARCNTPWGA